MATEAPSERKVLFQGIDKGSIAYKLLSSSGWKEGDGLGANKQGITAHLRVKKNADGQGVGASEKEDRNRNWTTGMMSFDMILAKLKAVGAAKAAATPKQDVEEEGESSDEEAQPASSPAKKASANKVKPAAAAAAEPATKKQKKTEKPAPSKAESSSGSDSDTTTPATAPKQATHLGRYAKRERGKAVRGYSSADLAAILGAAAAPAEGGISAWPKMAAVRAPHPLDASDSSEEEEEPVRETFAPVTESEKKKKSSKLAAAAAADLPPAEKRWWMTTFTKSGQMGSTRKELKSKSVTKPDVTAAEGSGKRKITITGFSETDQENLYTQAHEDATSGKQGLGISSAPKKVAGVRWAGTKTKLGSDDDEDNSEGEGEEQDDAESSEEEEKMVIYAPKMTSAAATAAAAAAVAAAEELSLPSAPSPKKQKQQQETPTVATAAQKKQRVEAEQAGGSSPGAVPTQNGGQCKGGQKAVYQQAGVVKGMQQPQDAAAKTEAVGQEVETSEGVETGGKVKWRKVIKAILADAPLRRLKLKALRKKALASCGGATGEALDGMWAAAIARVSSSDMFSVCEKYVTLL